MANKPDFFIVCMHSELTRLITALGQAQEEPDHLKMIGYLVTAQCVLGDITAKLAGRLATNDNKSEDTTSQKRSIGNAKRIRKR